MNRSHSLTQTLPTEELSRKTAIHEAGHAAAIYLGNKQKRLPPTFFQIMIDSQTNRFAKVDGGRLIDNLPMCIESATSGFSPAQKHAYQQAFETDIINLLVGPLAEANYVAQRDGEHISPGLVNLNALPAYGGASDLEIVQDYLQCLMESVEQREQKIAELFLAAFNFVSYWPNWFAITALANYILVNNRRTIHYEEIVAVLETYFLMANARLHYQLVRH